MLRKSLLLGVSLLVLAAVVLSGCGGGAKLGTEENPIIWSFVPSQDSEEVLAGAQQIADLVTEKTGLIIKTNVATEFAGVIEAMCNGEAHMGALNTFGYVLAHERKCADVAVASVRYGTAFYTGQLVANADAGIESIKDLAGKTFCRPDPLSTSGWIIPSIMLQAEGVNPDTDLKQVVDAGGHDGVITAVYNGDCDAGATFVDARTNVEDPDRRQRQGPGLHHVAGDPQRHHLLRDEGPRRHPQTDHRCPRGNRQRRSQRRHPESDLLVERSHGQRR
jgi:phosphonate transport system substrate-binding protein